MELTQHANGQESESKDTLFLLGGAALVVLGTGLILSTPIARQMLGGINIGNLVGAAIPKDFERYMKIRAM
jgi:hypothetical protein